MSPYDATIDLHDSYYASVAELRRRRVADRLRIEHGDCLEVIPRLVAEGVVVDAVVTDPPYGLEFMGKEWDTFRTNGGSAWSQKRAVGKDWKGRERERPGRLYMRSAHQTCRVCGKQSHQHDDAACLADYELVTHEPLQMRAFQAWNEAWGRAAFEILRPGGYLVAFGGTRTYHRLVCAIEDAGFVIQDQLAWLYGSGFPKHRSHLKPAHEPICLAYKPGGKRTLGVDECRIPTGEIGAARDYRAREDRENWRITGGSKGSGATSMLGRWPANVVHDGSAEVLAGFPESAAGVDNGERGRGGFWGGSSGEPCGPQYGDSGSAARFFYSAKADAADRWGSRHPTVKPIDLIRWLVTLVTPPGGTFLDPFAGSGTAAVAALASGRDAILIERDPGYVADIRERIAHYAGEGRHSLVAKGRGRREPAAGSLL